MVNAVSLKIKSIRNMLTDIDVLGFNQQSLTIQQRQQRQQRQERQE
ncbi:hypothetical protein [Streptomyces sp. ATMOS53]